MSDRPSATQRVGLEDALGFNPDDLAANREGRLSAAQQERLLRASRRTLIVGIIGIIIIGLGATVFIFLGQQIHSTILTIIGIAMTVINAAVVGFLIQNRIRSQNDLTHPVRAQAGIVNRTLRISGRTPTYLLRFEGENLIVNKPTFNAFIDGTVYKLYRSASSKTLLSAELVGMIDA
jgi:hypothetical protein